MDIQWASYMQPLSHQLAHTTTLQQAARYFSRHTIHVVVIVERGRVVGILESQDILAHIDHVTMLVEAAMQPVTSVRIEELSWQQSFPVIVENHQHQQLGVLTKEVLHIIMNDVMHHYAIEKKAFELTLEHAYEGIVVVDHQGIILEFNDAYSRFTGVPRQLAFGRHVTEIIENTQMHVVIQTGIAERNQQQLINGQEMRVHRLPLLQDGATIGAIGFLMFEEITKIYNVYDQMHQNNLLQQSSHMKEALHTHERDLIIQVLKEHGGNKVKTAAALGIHRTTLYQKLKKLNIE